MQMWQEYLLLYLDLTEVPISKIRGKTRNGEVVAARRICMVLINDKLNYSSTVNAAVFRRDHATVYMHSKYMLILWM